MTMSYAANPDSPPRHERRGRKLLGLLSALRTIDDRAPSSTGPRPERGLCMRPSLHAHHFGAAGLLLALATWAVPASTADIATAIGPVDTQEWRDACAANPVVPVVPSGAHGLAPCAGGADCLHRVVLDADEFPNATCSDGTEGVFYVRPGSNGDENRWVIHLQGGGSCRDYDTCLKRWCGQQGIYAANKMSSDWNADGTTDLPEHVVGTGIQAPIAANEFSDWTHVFAYYCSSDSWQGRASDVEFDNGVDSFHLDARGHTILSAMRRMLRKNNANPTWTAAGGYAVPDLDSATEIVFSGTSAGAKGAISNADWFLTPFSSSDNSLVLDGNFDMSDDALAYYDVWVDADALGGPDEPYMDARIDHALDAWAPGGYLAEIDAFVDESCRAFFEPRGRMDRCNYFSTQLILNLLGGVHPITTPIISTPTFVRFDLADNVVRKNFTQHKPPTDAGYSLFIGGPTGTQTTIDDFAYVVRASLLDAYDDHDSLTGVFAPRCGKHVGLENTHTFAVQTTPDTSDNDFGFVGVVIGSTTTFHDALWTWLSVGSGTRTPIRRLDTSVAGTSLSGC